MFNYNNTEYDLLFNAFVGCALPLSLRVCVCVCATLQCNVMLTQTECIHSCCLQLKRDAVCIEKGFQSPMSRGCECVCVGEWVG